MKYIKLFEAFKITIAYHGTPNGGFDKFDITKRGEGADQHGYGDWGNGFYFTTSKASATAYAAALCEGKIGNKPYVYTVNLKINNPFSFNKLRDFETGFMNTYVSNNKNGRPKPKDSILNISDEEIEQLLIKHNTTEEELDFMRGIESDLGDNWGDWDVASKLKEAGYDAIVVRQESRHDNEIVVFDEDQIQILRKEPLLVNKLLKKIGPGNLKPNK